MTIEPGTRFETLVRRGDLVPADDDHCADLFELTRSLTTAAGLSAYEISNHARPGEQSRHNLTYWRYGDYAGIGPGAHGRRGMLATERHRKPENYLSAIDRNGHGLSVERPLDAATRAMEALLMGLRLTEGVELSRIAAATGLAQAQLIDAKATEKLTSLGLVETKGDRITVTEQGMPLLDAILAELVAIEPQPTL